MKPIDFLVVGVVALVLALVGWFIYRSKKKGKKCIGCPDSGTCSGHCSGCSCGCSHAGSTKTD